METLVVNGVSVFKTQRNPMQEGDFYFRPEFIWHRSNDPWYRRWFLKQKSRLVHEMVSAIVISCPVCGLPIRTTPTANNSPRARPYDYEPVK